MRSDLLCVWPLRDHPAGAARQHCAGAGAALPRQGGGPGRESIRHPAVLHVAESDGAVAASGRALRLHRPAPGDLCRPARLLRWLCAARHFDGLPDDADIAHHHWQRLPNRALPRLLCRHAGQGEAHGHVRPDRRHPGARPLPRARLRRAREQLVREAHVCAGRRRHVRPRRRHLPLLDARRGHRRDGAAPAGLARRPRG